MPEEILLREGLATISNSDIWGTFIYLWKLTDVIWFGLFSKAFRLKFDFQTDASGPLVPTALKRGEAWPATLG